MVKKVVPIITCNPWNPVAIKNLLPYTESAIEKGASKYSIPWSKVKYNPKIIVIANLCKAWLKLFSMILWWVQVILKPELSRIIVFNNGILLGLKAIMFLGGQFIPKSIDGASLLW